MLYLLDTDAVVAFVGQTSAKLAQRFQAVRLDDVGLPSIVVHELAFGAYRSKKVDHNPATLSTLTRQMAVVDFTLHDARVAGESVPTSPGSARRSGLTMCSSPDRPRRGACVWSPTIRASSAGWRGCASKTGCSEPPCFSRRPETKR